MLWVVLYASFTPHSLTAPSPPISNPTVSHKHRLPFSPAWMVKQSPNWPVYLPSSCPTISFQHDLEWSCDSNQTTLLLGVKTFSQNNNKTPPCGCRLAQPCHLPLHLWFLKFCSRWPSFCSSDHQAGLSVPWLSLLRTLLPPFQTATSLLLFMVSCLLARPSLPPATHPLPLIMWLPSAFIFLCVSSLCWLITSSLMCLSVHPAIMSAPR